jgi:hypothetical protein
LQQWWDGLRPDVAAIRSAWNRDSCDAMLTAADNAQTYLSKSSIPPAYDNLTVAVANALGYYQGAAGYCPTVPAMASEQFSTAEAWMKKADQAVTVDGGQP